MTINDVKIRKVFSEGNLKVIVSITIDNCLAIHDIKIVQGVDRIFVAMPNRKGQNDYIDIAHPINSVTRNNFEQMILNAYERHIALEKILSDEQL